jgi:hypothetical protein
MVAAIIPACGFYSMAFIQSIEEFKDRFHGCGILSRQWYYPANMPEALPPLEAGRVRKIKIEGEGGF